MVISTYRKVSVIPVRDYSHITSVLATGIWRILFRSQFPAVFEIRNSFMLCSFMTDSKV